MLKNAYIYPITNRNKDGVLNPYLDNFIQSLEQNNIRFLNKTAPSDIGIMNLFKYLSGKLNYVFLNWIEDLPDKKMGKIQCLLLVYVIFPLLHMKRTKIVWTLHNKLSHYTINLKRKEWLFHKLIKKSDIILTHSSEGIEFVRKMHTKAATKVISLHHPVTQLNFPEKEATKNIDLLIWGTIQPYKGVFEFLEEFYKISELKKYKIVIAGKVPDQNYYNKLKQVLTPNIELRNEYISFEELNRLMHESKNILFTYKNSSVLSSGALMDSIVSGTRVIGPETGAFKDLKKIGLTDTFNKVSDLNDLLSKESSENKTQILQEFYEENNWSAFGKKLIKEL